MRLVVRELSVGYAKKELCSDINFELATGEIHFLIGANGKGKSTLLKTIAGLNLPLGGDVLLNEVSTLNYTSKQRADAFSYHRSTRALQSRVTVFDYLKIGMSSAQPFRHSSSDEQILKALAAVRITHIKGLYIFQISDGEFQKLTIALSLLRKTKVLLFDEPFSHLDPRSRQEVLNLFKEIAKEQILLICTHDLSLLEHSTNDVLAIDSKGQFVQVKKERVEIERLLREVF